jgi:hypothetical protein
LRAPIEARTHSAAGVVSAATASSRDYEPDSGIGVEGLRRAVRVFFTSLCSGPHFKVRARTAWGVAAAVPQPVGVNRKGKAGAGADALDEPIDGVGRE